MRNAFVKCGFSLFIVLFIALHIIAKPHDFFIKFKDRSGTTFSLTNPLQFLSARALERRQNQHILLDSMDLPVNPWYIDSLRKTGAKVLFSSKWYNAATVEILDTTGTVLQRIKSLSFVDSGKTQILRKRGGKVKSISIDQSIHSEDFSASEYGASLTQLVLCHGDALHGLGYKGKGKRIGIIDAGFYHADSMDALAHLFQNNKIIGTKNFVLNRDVYLGATHGEMVLSSIAGILPGKLYGTAVDADFVLLESENDTSEYPVEEDAWVAAAEYADSAGVDVINSSLGYTQFDDPTLNHTYSDLDGKTLRSSIAAGIASKKGIIVVNSAGNEGAQPWHYISAPADAIGILTAGAVDSNGLIARFSSRGPSYDGRIKPDVCAQGVAVVVADPGKNGSITRVSGTSLSAPILTGLTACLWEAFPDKSNTEIMDAIRMSANHVMHPDVDYGYGIPDFLLAYRILNNEAVFTEKEYLYELYPNPFTLYPTLSMYSSTAQILKAIISDMSGRVIYENNFELNANTFLNVPFKFLINYPSGIYVLTLRSAEGVISKKLIKQ